MFPTLINAARETLYMVGLASLFSILIGLPLGIFISLMQVSNYSFFKGGYYIFYALMQFVKYTPYLLIMLLCVPLSNWLIERQVTYITATVIPATAVTSIILAQRISNILGHLMHRWSHTSRTMGASKMQALWLILLPEGLPQIAQATFHTCSLTVGLSTIAGALGAGGLGQLAIEKSINEAEPLYVAACIVILVAMQQLIHYAGTLVGQAKPAVVHN